MNSISKISTMLWELCISIVLMLIKFYAYFTTHSNSILTDALESIVNVVAGLFALFSVWFASRPKDEDHPYGHGKIEYMSAGFEGALIFAAGFAIIFKSITGFYQPKVIHSIDYGIILTAFTGGVNFMLGRYLITKGKNKNSILMIADGKHLISDTVSSLGLIIGLVVIYFTKLLWLDNVVAIAFGLYIIYTGYQIIKESITSLLDETDYKKIAEFIRILNNNRNTSWIDIHNLRILKFGAHLHIDCHITLPWYFTLNEAHDQINLIESLIKKEFDVDIELFIHSDPCIPLSCTICQIEDCKVRQKEFVKRIDWDNSNLLSNIKHTA